MKRNTKAIYICQGAIIAAAYAVLTFISHLFGLDAGPVQVRVSEALCVLPVFTPSAIPGLFLGCLLANLLTGAVWLDIIFGPVATLLGALGAYALRKYKPLAPIPTVLANTLIVPFVLAYGYGASQAVPLLMLGVGMGELVSAYILGILLTSALEKRGKQMFL